MICIILPRFCASHVLTRERIRTATAAGNRVYIPCLHVFNKIDKITQEEAELMKRKLPHFLPISGSLGCVYVSVCVCD